MESKRKIYTWKRWSELKSNTNALCIVDNIEWIMNKEWIKDRQWTMNEQRTIVHNEQCNNPHRPKDIKLKLKGTFCYRNREPEWNWVKHRATASDDGHLLNCTQHANDNNLNPAKDPMDPCSTPVGGWLRVENWGTIWWGCLITESWCYRSTFLCQEHQQSWIYTENILNVLKVEHLLNIQTQNGCERIRCIGKESIYLSSSSPRQFPRHLLDAKWFSVLGNHLLGRTYWYSGSPLRQPRKVCSQCPGYSVALRKEASHNSQ